MQAPNVVLVTIDCLRYDRCGFNGHHRNTTPTLNKLASESYVFDRAYSTGPYTTESVPGILAGQHSYNGAYYGEDTAWKAIPAESPTLASYLQSNGYSTVATLTDPHLTEERNFDQGFEHYQNLQSTSDNKGSQDQSDNLGFLEDIYDKFDVSKLLYEIRSRMRDRTTVLNEYTVPYILYRYYQTHTTWPTVPGETVTDRLVWSLEATADPFFAWTHFMDVHAPINPTCIRQGGLAPTGRTAQHLTWDAARTSNIHEPRYETLYDSAIRFVDKCTDTIVENLQRKGVWDDTILIVTGDHGEVLYDRDGIYGHPRYHLYDELLHVPLLVRTPSEEGRRISRPFSLAWLHELLAELVALEGGNFPSESGLKSVLREGTATPNAIISDSLDDRGHTIAVRDTSDKLIAHEKVEYISGIDHMYFDRDILFNYELDIGERDQLMADHRPDLVELAHDSLTEPGDLPAVEGTFDRGVQSRLRDLGYKM